MVVQQLFQTLLDIQTSSQKIRRQLIRLIPGLNLRVINQILDETEKLETLFAQTIAQALGYTPMALGGLVTEPTLALIGESGPELVLPLSSPNSKKKRKVSKYQKQFGKELKKVKQTSRLKNGSYRSGWNREKEFSKAHKLTRKSMK